MRRFKTTVATMIALSISVFVTRAQLPAPCWYHPVVTGRATTATFVISANVACGTGYNVYLAHALTDEDCRWWPPHSMQVLTETQIVEPLTFRWTDYMEPPAAGDRTCVWWDCKCVDDTGAYLHFDVIREGVLGETYMPLVTKGESDEKLEAVSRGDKARARALLRSPLGGDRAVRGVRYVPWQDGLPHRAWLGR